MTPEVQIWRRYYNDLRADLLNGIMMLIDRLEQAEARIGELEKQQQQDRDDGR